MNHNFEFLNQPGKEIMNFSRHFQLLRNHANAFWRASRLKFWWFFSFQVLVSVANTIKRETGGLVTWLSVARRWRWCAPVARRHWQSGGTDDLVESTRKRFTGGSNPRKITSVTTQPYLTFSVSPI
jgi:hypothetical protein